MRKESLYINKDSAWSHGIAMGENFLSVLEKPLEIKDYIKNESRLEDGVRIISTGAKVKMRNITLTFNIHGKTPTEYNNNKSWLESQFYNGAIDITTDTHRGKVIYHLLYTGQSITYDESGAHTEGKLTAGFCEPNPRHH